MAFQFKINQAYNIPVIPTAVLGTDFNNVTVVGILNYRTALHFADIDAIQASVFPYLPQGTPNRPEEYEYLQLQTATPNTPPVILARQWINEAAVVAVTNSKIVVTIEGAGAQDIDDVRAALVQNGYENLNIRVTN